MLSDEYPDFDAVSPRTLGGTPVALHLVVPDVDATWVVAIEHGAVGRRPPEDQPYGDRAATFIDPFGHRWMVSTPIGTPTAREIDDASDGFTVITPDP
jgi:PhnB protein